MKKIIGILTTFITIIYSRLVSAAGLVPCGGAGENSCTFCDLFTLAENIIRFIRDAAIPLTVVFIIYGGFTILASTGNTGKIKRGKDIITAAIVGLIIALSAWLILGIVFQVLSGNGVNWPWTVISCGTSTSGRVH